MSWLRLPHLQGWLEHGPRLLAELLQELLCFVYPPRCVGCSRALASGASLHFCGQCQPALKQIRRPFCPRCGLPFAAGSIRSHLCGDCLGRQRHFDRARAPLFYGGLVRQVLHRFKYGGETFLVRPLTGLLEAPARRLCWEHRIELLMPVPLHSLRLRQRGFNQASLLARRLGKHLQIETDYSCLRRQRWTEAQTGLSRRQRAANVKGAFDLRRPQRVRNRGVLLLDDVLTTGETVDQCAAVLKAAGAREVLVLTVARAAAASGERTAVIN